MPFLKASLSKDWPFGTTERAAENSMAWKRLMENIPQGLKPAFVFCLFGTTEVVPFQNGSAVVRVGGCRIHFIQFLEVR